MGTINIINQQPAYLIHSNNSDVMTLLLSMVILHLI